MTQLRRRYRQLGNQDERSPLRVAFSSQDGKGMAVTSRVKRELYARFCGRLEVKFLRPTRQLKCGGRSLGFGTVELSLLDHVHRLDAGNQDARAAKGLESEHRPHDPLDGPMVLFDDVVEVFRLAQLDVRAGVGTHAPDGRRVGAALVDGDLLGHTVKIDGAFEEAPRRSVVSVSPKQKVDRGTGTIDGSVQVFPRPATLM